jgi:hypothetical protein
MKINVSEMRATKSPSSEIYVVEDTMGNDDGFKSMIGLMEEKGRSFYKKKGSPRGIVASNSVVIVKVNSQWDERGGTNTDLVKSIIEEIVSHPDGFKGEVVIADNGQAQYGSTRHGGSLDYEVNNAVDPAQSNKKVAESFKEHKVSTYLWDDITTNRIREYSEGDTEDGYIIYDAADPITGIFVSYPKFRTKYGKYISFRHGVWNPGTSSYNSKKLVLLNVPVLKGHFIYGVTACVKHYMGVVSDKLQSGTAHRAVRTGGMGTMIAMTRAPDLNILDAIYVNSTCGKGPSCSLDDATQLNLVMASTDPVALDYWATKNVLMEVAKQQDQTDLSKFDLDNTEPGSHGEWMKKSVAEMQKAGLPFTDNMNRVNVYKTSA